jgi:hypothetical protein
VIGFGGKIKKPLSPLGIDVLLPKDFPQLLDKSFLPECLIRCFLGKKHLLKGKSKVDFYVF